jgi:hypothetical protein
MKATASWLVEVEMPWKQRGVLVEGYVPRLVNSKALRLHDVRVFAERR